MYKKAPLLFGNGAFLALLLVQMEYFVKFYDTKLKIRLTNVPY